ncbi:MAG: hypothetical protein GY802_23550, partial [Gammaproteobacteria bacterium]|nr:hypothetical protein [Gammaproteobacteria bacterium]
TNSGGTLVLTFNTNATSALVDSTLQSIAYSNSSDTPPATAQIDWSFDDGNAGSQGTGGALQATGSTTVTITAVNDEPTLSGVTANDQTFTEGGTISTSSIFTGVTIDTIEAGQTILQAGITLGGVQTGDKVTIDSRTVSNINADAGTTALGGASTHSYSISSGVLTIEFAAGTTEAQAQTVLNNIGFAIVTSDDPDTTTRTFTGLTVQDSGGVLNSGDDTSAASAVQTDITVVALNDAPVLSGSNNLTDITEDAFTNNGTLVSALIAGHITDVDSGASEGIAVTGVDNSNGTWEYSINGGTNWNTLGSPSDMNARLLADDASTRVRFVPNADYFGTVAGGITFRAWDQTAGNNGDEVNLSGTDSASDGFSTVSYSNNDGTTNWTSSWIEDDGEGGGAGSGYFNVNGGSLQLELAAGDGGDNIYREVDLTGATSATLNFD